MVARQHNKNYLVILTKRLILRDFNEEDWKSVHEYASDPEVVRYVEFGPNTEEESKNFIHRALVHQKEKPRKDFTLAIVLKATNTLIGGCGIYLISPDNQEGSIGYVLNRNFWGQGYATETAQALLEFGFNQLKLHRISATCDPKNTSSARVLEKIGMRREAYFHEHKWIKGKWRDSLLYAILEHEWANLKHSKIK
ncbi:MAG: GNAT family N-acetyltransferase [Candidatus Bathyarchaeota archaeon]|jgi:RimJ/RimL family protein N-acetyltransferase|nr:GNAT family N-acetyltransferase [Candidatus Bathyarchaeota archaeon]